MQEPIYRQALQRSFQLVLGHKTLWIFGVLSLLVGQLGWNNFIGGLTVFGGESFFGTYVLNLPWGTLFNSDNFFWSSWLVFIVLAVFLLVLLFSVASEGALIAAGTAWFKSGKSLKIDAAWHKGVKHFPRLLALDLIKKALLIELLLLINSTSSSFINGRTIFSNFILICLITMGIFLALVIVSIGIFASAYVVESELPLLTSIRKGAELFYEHILVTLELSLLLLGIQIAVVLCLAYLSVWFLLPFAAFSVFASFSGSMGMAITGLFASAGIFLIISAILGGILNAFTISSWMYVFMKMHHEGVVSRIMHLVGLKKA